MGPESLKRYLFKTPDQWRSGLRQNLIVNNSGLQPAHRLEPRSIEGILKSDSRASLAFDPVGTLCWVREHSFEYVRNLDGQTFVSASFQLPMNPNDWQTKKMVVGTNLIWLLLKPIDNSEKNRLIGFSTDDFNCSVNTSSDWEIIDIARAKHDELYAVAKKNNQLWVISISNSGHIRSLIELPAIQSVAIADIPGMDAIVILDCKSDTLSCDDRVLWRVLFLDLSCSDVPDKLNLQEIFRYERRIFPCDTAEANFTPCAIAIDCSQTIQLCNLHTGELFALGLDGETRGYWCCLFSECTLPIVSLAAADNLMVSGSTGILKLEPQDEINLISDSDNATFITPALISPDGVIRGWSRADLAIDLDEKLAIEIRVAYTSDPLRIKQISDITQDTTLTNETRLRQLEDWLPWDHNRTFVFNGSQWPKDRPLRFPLHEIDATHIWLMIKFDSNDQAKLPTLKSLQVSYPNISYTNYLPAVFKQDTTGARHLRNLMTVIESVFGEQDNELAQLPKMLDPRTAPANWIPYLLRWLGLPIATELDVEKQRALLIAAPELLRWRGSFKALNDLLRLLVGSEFRLYDLGAGPTPWSLPCEGRLHYGPRLGHETLVFCAAQPGFSPGKNSTLGSSRLGYSKLKTSELYARRIGLIKIFVATNLTTKTKVETLLKRYLPYFVPAHCRYQLHLVDPESLPAPRYLTNTTQFNSPGPVRLGNTLVLGNSHLPVPENSISETGVTELSSDTVMRSGDYMT